MQKKKKPEMSQMIVRVPKDLHMEVKAQAAYRGQALQEYVAEALLIQIAEDKKYQ